MSIPTAVVDSFQLLSKELTEQEIIEFFNKQTKQHNCPVCLQNNWSILLHPDAEFGLAGVRRDSLPDSFPLNIPTIAVACNSCGYLRLHAKAIVVEKMKALVGESP